MQLRAAVDKGVFNDDLSSCSRTLLPMNQCYILDGAKRNVIEARRGHSNWWQEHKAVARQCGIKWHWPLTATWYWQPPFLLLTQPWYCIIIKWCLTHNIFASVPANINFSNKQNLNLRKNSLWHIYRATAVLTAELILGVSHHPTA